MWAGWRAADIPANFDRPGTSNGSTEAINGRLEHLRGSALGFRSLTNYMADPYSRPADSGPSYTLDCDEPVSLSSTQSVTPRSGPGTGRPGWRGT